MLTTAAAPSRNPDLGRARMTATGTLFLLSGLTGLTYEVLWMRELKLLFGSTAHAAAVTLAAFFLGIALGSWAWGRRAARVGRPLRAYALLELAVAGSALLVLVLLDVYHAIYGGIYGLIGTHRAPLIVIKFVLSIGVLVPPAFFMGGTLPMMSQYMVRRINSLGRTASGLYAINTFGAALGAYLAGFHLPLLMGFANAYRLAIVLTIGIAIGAWLLDALGREARHDAAAEGAVGDHRSLTPTPAACSLRTIRRLAALSGFAAMGLEVLWTRMFEQVLQNSVYTFSLILVIFLACLAAGGALASRLARLKVNPAMVLGGLLIGGGLLTAASPIVFGVLTDGLIYLAMGEDWPQYLLEVFSVAAATIVPPGLLLGTLFPYLIKVSEPYAQVPGRTVGDLAAINTAGAIAGSLAAGFLLLDILGLYPSMRVIGASYLVAAVLVAAPLPSRTLWQGLAAAAILAVGVFGRLEPPIVRVDEAGQERLVDVVEGSTATVAVIERRQSLRMKINNLYSLGDTSAIDQERRQTHLPLSLHPDARSVYFLGMGTGITAGAALDHPVDRVVVSELVPEVVRAARRHFQPYVNGLFEDPRVTVLAEDGRNHLHGTSDRYDLIIADLFVPWKAGVGNLYSIEHYTEGREHLRPGGMYAQWLPLYQLTEQQAATIARTMNEVFASVTLWRGDFRTDYPIAMLLGRPEDGPFDLSRLGRTTDRPMRSRGGPHTPVALHNLLQANNILRDPAMLAIDGVPHLMFYCGNLSAAPGLLEAGAVNTDNHPVIEYRAPIDARRREANKAPWLTGAELIGFIRRLQAACPPERDPVLANLSARQRSLPRAALYLQSAQLFDPRSQSEPFWRTIEQFKRLAGIE